MDHLIFFPAPSHRLAPYTVLVTKDAHTQARYLPLTRIPMYTAVTLATFDLVKDHFAAGNLLTAQNALKFEL